MRLPDLPARPDISIHAPRVGGDNINGVMAVLQRHFNPRPPCGGRLVLNEGEGVFLDFNPRPPCGGRPMYIRKLSFPPHISIHAPRVGGDYYGVSTDYLMGHFNPRPRVGGDARVAGSSPAEGTISIHAPRVGGDGCRSCSSQATAYFNPRPPCGGRLQGIR